MLPCSSRRSMEEVWRDISIPPSLDHSNAASRGIILQDFLAGPVTKKTASPAASSAGPPPFLHQLSAPLLPPAPTTALSLNPALSFPTTNQQPSNGNSNSRRHSNFVGPPFMAPSVGHFSFCIPSKPALLDDPAGGSGGGGRGFRDGRHKRLMKNRESAARSRARKQAYTNELELEVEHLVAENEKLRKQYQELRSAMEAQHSTKSRTLQRTSTAPF